MQLVWGLAALAVGAGLLAVWGSVLPRLPARTEWLLAIGSAAGAAAAPGHPIGLAPLDLALRAALGAAVALAGARAPFAFGAFTAAIASAALLVGSSTLGALACASLGLVLAQLAIGERPPLLRSLAAALALQSLLRLHWPLARGLSAIVVAVAVLPLLVAAYQRLARPSRRIVRRTLLGIGVFLLLGTALGVLAAVRAKQQLDHGLQSALLGLDSIGSDDNGTASTELDNATAAFRDAQHTIDSWWAAPARLVPFVAQNTRAVAAMAQSGSELTAKGRVAVEGAKLRTLSPVGGRVDLDAIRALQQPLADTVTALRSATDRLRTTDSPWLVPLVGNRFKDLAAEVADATTTTQLAADAARLAPGMLGADGPRRYLLVVQNPSEERGAGGFMGDYGEIDATDGTLQISELGQIKSLNDARQPVDTISITGEDDYLARYGAEVARTWGVNNFSPDYPTVARVIAQLYPQSGGQALDGVISVDPYGLAALLKVVGQVKVAGWPDPIGADNAASILLHDEYIAFDPDAPAATTTTTPDKPKRKKNNGSSSSSDPSPEPSASDVTEEQRTNFLGNTAKAVFDKMLDTGFKTPAALAKALSPAVQGRHLQLMSAHPDETALFELMGATGGIAPLRGDSIGFTAQNYNGNKIDWYLTRQATYDVQWDPSTGSVQGTLQIKLANAAPAAGLPHSVIGWGGDASSNQTPTADGENLMLLSVYSAFPLQTLTLDGAPLGANQQRELGRYVYTAYVSLPPGGTRTVLAAGGGTIAPGAPYQLDPVWQPVVTPDHLDVHLHVASGWEIASAAGLARSSAREADAAWVLDRRWAVDVAAQRADSSPLAPLKGDP